MSLYKIDLTRPLTHQETINILNGTPACPFSLYKINKPCPPYALNDFEDKSCRRCILEHFNKKE
jgi:hypothetical protein